MAGSVEIPALAEPPSMQSEPSTSNPIGTNDRETSSARRTTHTRRTESERYEQSLDKVYADFVKFEASRKLPHMEWDGSDFVPQRPAPQPVLRVNATIMVAAHKKFGVAWKGSRRGLFKSKSVDGIADTGCQVPLAGVDFLEEIGCPKEFLVPTSHGIMGISRTTLGIIGSVFLRLELDGAVARQMVHVSPKVKGLYFSETTLKQLGVLSENFPGCSVSHSDATTEPHCSCVEEGTPCLPRSATPDRPQTIPFEPVMANRSKLKEWLLQAFASSAFNQCTHQPLQSMTGAPMKIIEKEGVTPSYCYTPIPVAFNWKKKVKEDIDRDVRLGIIEPVPQGTVTDWCSRMVIAAKANGDPRRTIDFQRVNEATRRETHHTPSPFNLVSSIPSDKLKTVLDAWNGYHSLLLDQESKRFTTFITEFGRYWYNRGPQGFHGTGDAYTRRFDDITKDEERYLRIIDDGLLYDGNLEDAFWHTFDHLKLCADNGVVFNTKKFQFAGETVDFAGFEVTMNGFKPSPRILESISNFPTPTNITDVKAWFGLVGHVSYAASLGELMQPFRSLLSSKNQAFYWDKSLDDAFERSKHDIVELVKEGVRSYDVEKHTCLTTDWSKEGIGFSLTQKHCSCHGLANPNCGNDHWKLVFAGSKALNKAEQRYAPIEGEALAVAHGLEKTKIFTLGCRDLTVVTDHKPLTRILNDRSLDTISNPRVFKFKERTLPFRYRIMHVPGESGAMKTADAMSRHPAPDPSDHDDKVDEYAKAFAASQGDAIESVTWEAVNNAAAVDEECVSLVQLILDGFPSAKSSLPPYLQRYWGMREEMYVVDNVPFKGRKMLIPKRLRPQVLDGLHAANQGATGMLANARDRFFWPGLDAAIHQLRLQCRQCNETAPSQRAEPLIITPTPDYPFQQAVSDFCDIEGHTFLIYADRFSGWVEVERLATNTFRNVEKTFLRWFATFGVPEEISSDGGPPFNGGDYDQFCKNWGVSRRSSSAYYPTSNGRAEAAVKSAKRILSGNINPVSGSLNTSSATRALMTHRNTPSQDTGVSPAVLLFGRPMRDHLPRLKRELRTEWDMIAQSREQALAKRVNRSIPSDSNHRKLPSLTVGDNVQIQNQHGNRPKRWYTTGVVTQALPNRQYTVMKDGSRRVTLRNRRFLRKISPLCRTAPEVQLDDPTVKVNNNLLGVAGDDERTTELEFTSTYRG